MRTIFAPYDMRVSAARHLAEAFDSFRIRPEGSRFRPRADDLIVNWGRSDLPRYTGRILNHPDAVAVCTNKLASFHAFREHEVPCVEWTDNGTVALSWLAIGDYRIAGFARTKLTGRGGDGIVPIYAATEYGPEGEVWTRAPLYTRYFKRKFEFRVHVFNGDVIGVQQKKLRNGTEKNDLTYKVRSYANGWIFARNEIDCPPPVLDASIRAVRALGLDFGGVDVGYNQHDNRAAVFEVNSAPGISGTTLKEYEDAIRCLVNQNPSA